MTYTIKTWKERKGLLNSEQFRAFIGVEWEMQAEIDQLRAALTEALAAQPVREPLSNEQINSIWKKWVGTQRANMSFVRAIERAHGIGGDK